MNETLNGLCIWLRETKGITKIHITELMGYLPEYEEYIKNI
jgi:hypothetical protein